MADSRNKKSRPEPTIVKRRNSSFSSTSSPWFRRNSFLSPSMIKNENFSVYEAPSYYSDAASYSIISLKECQGFVFNQDLFATPYQQSCSLANEKKIRALSFSSRTQSHGQRSRSKSKSVTPTNSEDCPPNNAPYFSYEPVSKHNQQRRHTSYHTPRPAFLSGEFHNDEDEDAVMDDSIEENEPLPLYDDENAIADEYDEYDEEEEEEEEEEYGNSGTLTGYGGDADRTYKVHVTEIRISERDNDIFPK
ncbi:hypothetical protein G9P44_001536 [Scheffersomyces stipitis]|nr:hypothetical protein G9P44_001536 [Scheffersomyces stipitis]